MKHKYNTLEDLINNHLEIHKGNFEKDGEAMNMLIAYTDTESILMPLIFKSEKDKEEILSVIKLVFVALGVKRYTIGIEAYRVGWPKDFTQEQAMEEYNKLKQEGKSLKDHPDHVEILSCMAVSHTESIALSYDIDAKSRKLVNPSDIMTDVEGTFTELLPPPNIPVEVTEQAQKLIDKIGIPFKRRKLDYKNFN